MPLRALAEAALQPIFEVVAHVAGYGTARLLVPVFTLGSVQVEPALMRKAVTARRQRIERSEVGGYVLEAEFATLLGLVFWVVVGILTYSCMK